VIVGGVAVRVYVGVAHVEKVSRERVRTVGCGAFRALATHEAKEERLDATFAVVTRVCVAKLIFEVRATGLLSSRGVEVEAVLLTPTLLDLFLSTPAVLFEVFALGHGTIVIHTLLGMNLQKRPSLSTELAPARGFDGARERVLEKVLDLWAVAVVALRVAAVARVDEQLHRTLNLSRTVFALCLRHRRAIASDAALAH